MPISAGTLRILIAKGLAGDDLLEVVAAIDADMSASRPVEFPVDRAAEKRRAWDRERKAKTRHSGGIPPDSPPDKNAPLSKREKKEKRERAASEIPPDWKPTDEDRSYARSKGLTEAQIDREAERMLNHFIASKKRWSDWAAVWRNWILKAADFLGCKPTEHGAPLEAVPQFNTHEEWQAWWNARQSGSAA